ncbi:Ig-like domain-containing protein, partial [Pseudomonas mosselii]|uniref:Ig-like domain-containing protein n=1 Tax=Pseudomonas mosselii TaxID=78327 RepID=UPI003F410C31
KNGNWSFTTPTLEDGEHAINIIVQSASGIQSPASDSRIINVKTSVSAPVFLDVLDDSEPVQKIITEGGVTSDSTPVIWGMCASGSTVYLYDGLKLLGEAEMLDTFWTFVPTTPLDDGPHNLRAVAFDSIGNISADATFSLTVETSEAVHSRSLMPEVDTANFMSFNLPETRVLSDEADPSETEGNQHEASHGDAGVPLIAPDSNVEPFSENAFFNITELRLLDSAVTLLDDEMRFDALALNAHSDAMDVPVNDNSELPADTAQHTLLLSMVDVIENGGLDVFAQSDSGQPADLDNNIDQLEIRDLLGHDVINMDGWNAHRPNLNDETGNSVYQHSGAPSELLAQDAVDVNLINHG